MGRKVLLSVICWLTLSQVLGEATKTVNSSVAKDNESAESAPRLYHNIPIGVYASAAPYGSYSFPVPSYIRSPQPASSQVHPVKAGTVIIPSDAFLKNLKDSYGKYVHAPQSYKTAFPQQFVPLQDLPPHLAQPLVSVSPSYQFKSVPNYFFGPQGNKVPTMHFSEPLVYAEDLKNFAPYSTHQTTVNRYPVTSQTVETKAHSTRPPAYQHQQEKSGKQVVSPKHKDTKHQASSSTKEGQIQASPAQTSVTTFVNGKKTVINVETKPPVPLLDLNLLEPLTFDTPLVSQLQHYLPKISSATYHKLPSFNVKEPKKTQKDVIVTKTKSYDSGYTKIKPLNITPKKKPSKPKQHNKPIKPTVTVKGNPNGDEFTYEINTPNHKEVYNEQVLKYNKETNMKPVNYAYNQQTHKEPEVYTYVHSSKEPLKVTHVEYDSSKDGPKHLVYNASPEEQDEEEKEDVHQTTSQDSGESEESSDESEEEGPEPQTHNEESPNHYSHHHTEHHESPKYTQHHQAEHHESPKYTQHNKQGNNYESPRHQQQHPVSYEVPASPRPFQHYSEYHSQSPSSPPQPQYFIIQQGNSGSPKPTQQSINFRRHEEAPKPFQHINFQVHDTRPTNPTQYHESYQSQNVHHEPPLQSHQLKAEHRGQQLQHRPNQEVHHEVHVTPQQYLQPLTVNVQNAFQPITPEYEEDIRLLPTHKPHASIQQEQNHQHSTHRPHAPTKQEQNNQHPTHRPHAQIKQEHNVQSQLGPLLPHPHTFTIHSSPAPHKLSSQHQEHPVTIQYKPHSSPSPHVHEKSKRIIIKEKEETPNEMHTHMEQVMAEMIDREENGEEDFEKGYKESAFGFPAYEQTFEDIEKDIYNPDSYGVPKNHNEYNINDAPFVQYQQDGDEFPKSARLAYKDARENNKEDYYLDFAVHKPESYTDRFKNKVNYYKMYKKNRPEKLYVQVADDGDRKEKKSEKFTVAPSFDFFGSSSKPKAKQSKLFSQYKAAPIKYEYDYSKDAPRDSTAFASRPYHKHRTHFVEPQFQYGFEPIAFDSELAAMASNDSPESEKPGTRKKIYKENWYIKKTSTTGNKPS